MRLHLHPVARAIEFTNQVSRSPPRPMKLSTSSTRRDDSETFGSYSHLGGYLPMAFVSRRVLNRQQFEIPSLRYTLTNRAVAYNEHGIGRGRWTAESRMMPVTCRLRHPYGKQS